MNKKQFIIIILSLFGLLLVSVFGFWISSFFLFESPTELVIKQECDYEGLRKSTIYELNGNAVTNETFHITVSDCNENTLSNSEIIFTVSSSNLETTDLNFEWKNLDTLTIKYNKGLEVFKQKTVSESVYPKIVIEYVIE